VCILRRLLCTFRCDRRDIDWGRERSKCPEIGCGRFAHLGFIVAWEQWGPSTRHGFGHFVICMIEDSSWLGKDAMIDSSVSFVHALSQPSSTSFFTYGSSRDMQLNPLSRKVRKEITSLGNIPHHSRWARKICC
jgi:hypothetical protein